MAFRIASTSGVELKKPSRKKRSQSHLSFIRKLPCVSCGRTPSEAAHIRKNDLESDRFQALGMKPSDKWTAPLCVSCHRESPGAQHVIGEQAFWSGLGIDENRLAQALWDVSGNTQAGSEIVYEARRLFPRRGE
jgi:hypothetical protein